jgi:hypothetical protein
LVPTASLQLLAGRIRFRNLGPSNGEAFEAGHLPKQPTRWTRLVKPAPSPTIYLENAAARMQSMGAIDAFAAYATSAST